MVPVVDTALVLVGLALLARSFDEATLPVANLGASLGKEVFGIENSPGGTSDLRTDCHAVFASKTNNKCFVS